MTTTPEPDATVAYLMEHSKHSNNPAHRTATASVYFGVMETVHQHPPEVIKAIAASQKHLANSMLEVTRGDVIKLVEEARANGEDPLKVRADFTLSIPGGQIITNVSAHRVVTTPKKNADDATVTTDRYGMNGIRVRVTSMIDSKVGKETEEIIGRLLKEDT